MKKPEYNQFYIAFLDELNQQNIKYIIIGGWAVIYHGYIYHTLDLDIWYKPSKENVEKIYNIIKKLGYDVSDLQKEDLLIIDIRPTPIWNREKGSLDKIDFMSGVKGGLSFEDALERCEKLTIGELKVNVLSYRDLKITKKAANRNKDREHLLYLEKIKKYERQLKRKRTN